MTGLSEQQLAEIQATDIGEWCEGPWTQDPVEGPEGEAGHFLVKDRDGQVVAMVPHWAGPIALFIAASRTDVPALLAEVARLRGALSEATGYVAELEADIGGWSARVAELEAERHSTNEAPSDAAEALRAKDDRITRLEDALAAAGKSLSAFIFDSSDPGSDALGAQWLVRQVMPQVDDPFAQPRAFRASVFEEAAKAIEGLDRASDDDHRKRTQAYLDGYEDGICAAAEHMNLMADRAAEGRDQS